MDTETIHGIHVFVKFIFRKTRNVLFVLLFTTVLFFLHINKHHVFERAKKHSKVLHFDPFPSKQTFGRDLFEQRQQFSEDSDQATGIEVSYGKISTTLTNPKMKKKNSVYQIVSPTVRIVPKAVQKLKRQLSKKSKTIKLTKSTRSPFSSTGLVTSSASKQNWLRSFTANLPKNLSQLLQSILTRDFEKVNGLKVIKKEGMDSSGRCKRGFFRLRGMDHCEKWLQCEDIDELKVGEVLGNGVGKIINKAKWRNIFDVALVKLRDDRIQYKMFVGRVQSGVDNLMTAQPSPYVTQIIGHCSHGNNTVLVMEGCEYGNFRQFYSGSHFRQLSVIEKFKFAIQMVAEMDYLHRGLGLPRINCDVHNPTQGFGQYLVSSDLRLFLNDMDELPIVDKSTNQMADCQSEPFGVMSMPEFLAPEIRYTPKEHELHTDRKPVDEKSDVWKIPDLIANIMTSQNGVRGFGFYESNNQYYLKRYLHSIHEKCKILDPKRRPTSRDVLIVYLEVYANLMSGKLDPI